ncbi:MAG: BMP family ABC transporter substrate-binding protein [bacterium]
MKKLLSVISLCVLGLAATGCDSTEYTVALVTDKGTINDGSFNEGSWNGILNYCKENEVTYNYYQPADATDQDRWNSVQLAVRGGAEIVVLPGYLFESIICNASQTYPDTNFLLLDGSYKNDSTFGAVYDETKDYSNVYCVNYQEEQAGYLAGYAAVMDGNRSLGFMGGVEMPAVTRFGYGYVQGAEKAASDLGLGADSISMRYNYIGDFVANQESDNLMTSWFGSSSDPVDVVFSCGGGIWTSVKDAIIANSYKGKMIGVDVDQYKDGNYTNNGAEGNFVLTSATKGLANSVETVLDIFFTDNWSTVSADIDTLGLGTTTTSTQYVGLPTDKTSWGFDTFTVSDYTTVVNKIQLARATSNTAYYVNPTTQTVSSAAALESLFNLSCVNVISFTK